MFELACKRIMEKRKYFALSMVEHMQSILFCYGPRGLCQGYKAEADEEEEKKSIIDIEDIVLGRLI